MNNEITNSDIQEILTRIQSRIDNHPSLAAAMNGNANDEIANDLVNMFVQLKELSKI